MQETLVGFLAQEDSRGGGQLSPCATTTEAQALESLCSPTSEATAVRSPSTAGQRSPCLPQLEKAQSQQRRPKAAKNYFKKTNNYAGEDINQDCPQPPGTYVTPPITPYASSLCFWLLVCKSPEREALQGGNSAFDALIEPTFAWKTNSHWFMTIWHSLHLLISLLFPLSIICINNTTWETNAQHRIIKHRRRAAQRTSRL